MPMDCHQLRFWLDRKNQGNHPTTTRKSLSSFFSIILSSLFSAIHSLQNDNAVQFLECFRELLNPFYFSLCRIQINYNRAGKQKTQEGTRWVETRIIKWETLHRGETRSILGGDVELHLTRRRMHELGMYGLGILLNQLIMPAWFWSYHDGICACFLAIGTLAGLNVCSLWSYDLASQFDLLLASLAFASWGLIFIFIFIVQWKFVYRDTAPYHMSFLYGKVM